MRIVTLRTAAGTRAARIDGSEAVETGHADVGELLAGQDWAAAAAAADGPRHAVTGPGLAGLDLAPLIPRPGKIICAGLNYRNHILEMSHELPRYPTLFAKFADTLTGPNDPIELPPESPAVDWEAELAVIIGTAVRRADEAQAAAAIAGFSVLNDVSMRDWQNRTQQWLQGKAFEATTPLGPALVTPDELPGGTRPALALSSAVDGEVMQSASTADLVFDPVFLVGYISQFTTLRPGDVIATGTPGGVGHARKPPRYLAAGMTMVTAIDGLGRLENPVTAR